MNDYSIYKGALKDSDKTAPLWHIYSKDMPQFILDLANTPAMLRLKDIGMGCGTQYANFKIHGNIADYSKWEHSVGVALIVWNFTMDVKQTVAGLLHDIATPVFAHVIDLVNGDYVTQESTEKGTKEIIENSAEIQQILSGLSLTTEDVYDYHRYPIADNTSPLLSADRLEYSLGDFYYYGLCNLNQIRELYKQLIIIRNESGEPELGFNTKASADLFAELSMKCSNVYVSDETLITMAYVRDVIKYNLEIGAISRDDLYTDETTIIKLIQNSSAGSRMWDILGMFKKVHRESEKSMLTYSTKIEDNKRRYIDPLIKTGERVSAYRKSHRKAINELLNKKFDYYLTLNFWCDVPF